MVPYPTSSRLDLHQLGTAPDRAGLDRYRTPMSEDATVRSPVCFGADTDGVAVLVLYSENAVTGRP